MLDIDSDDLWCWRLDLRQQDIQKIESAEMWLYRRLLRVKWDEKRTNASILKELKTKRELVSTVMKRKLSFFGHTIRNNKCTLMKDVMQGRLEAGRKQGRPRTHYIQNVRDWSNMNTYKIYDTARRRDDWRGLVRKAMRAANTEGCLPRRTSRWSWWVMSESELLMWILCVFPM